MKPGAVRFGHSIGFGTTRGPAPVVFAIVGWSDDVDKKVLAAIKAAVA